MAQHWSGGRSGGGYQRGGPSHRDPYQQQQQQQQYQQSSSSSQYGGGGTGVSRPQQRGEFRPLEVTTGIMNYLDRRTIDGTACGPKRARRTYPLQPHPAWRRLQTLPRDEEEWLTSGVTNALISSSGRQRRIEVKALGWSLDGRRLVTANNEGSLTAWSGVDFSHFQTLEGQHRAEDGGKVAINALSWTRDGLLFITGDDQGGINVFDWTMTKINKNTLCPSPGMAINSLSVAPTTPQFRFVSGGVDKKLRIWDLYEEREEMSLEGHIDRIHCVDWHPSFAMLASASKDCTIKLWDPRAAGDKCLATLQHHKSEVTKCSWNPTNGYWLLSASKDQTLRLFDIRSTKEPVELLGHEKEINSIAWHPSHERLFASGAGDGALAFWGVGTGNTPKVIIKPDEKDIDINTQTGQPFIRPLYAMAWHPMGHCLATGSRDQTVKFWCRKGAGHSMLSPDIQLSKSTTSGQAKGQPPPLPSGPSPHPPLPPSSPPPSSSKIKPSLAATTPLAQNAGGKRGETTPMTSPKVTVKIVHVQ